MNNFEFKGYRGSTTLKRAGSQIQWTPELIEQLKLCSEDPIYFAENHIKIVNIDEGLIPIELFDYQREIILSMHNNRYTVGELARQLGKFLFVDHPLPLYNGGFTTMGKVQVGDVLIDADGKPTTVTYKSDIINRPAFRITFDDGTFCDAGDEHQWEVYDRFEGQAHRPHKRCVLTTQQLFESQWKKLNKTTGYTEYRYYIPNTKPVEYQQRKQLIDPYVLGVWLGDGTSRNRMLSCDINDVKHYENQNIEFGRRVLHKRQPNLFSASIKQISNKDLNHYKLRGNKHIPDDYLYGSIQQRTDLIQGLFDTDGFIEKNGLCCIQLSTQNNLLIEQIYQLLCSMGLKVRQSNHIDKKQNKTSIRLAFSCGKDHLVVSRIPRKNNRQKTSLPRARYVMSRTIQNIQPIKSKPAQCISVNNPRRLYLCGKQYLPTHNTVSICCYVLWYILFNPNKTVAILANKAETAREILSRIQLAYEHLPKWIQHGVVEWNKGSFELENGSRVLATATSSTNIRGFSINLLIIDEAAFIEGWDEFFASVFPTISSGNTSKLVLISTVNGLNHFHKITSLAREGLNNFNLISADWTARPGRDESWKQQTLAAMNFDHDRFAQEHENRYLGSSGTLIAGWRLEQLMSNIGIPLRQQSHSSMYHPPQKDRKYMAVCDVSRGKALDYSAMQIIDVSEMPYKQVFVYRDNTTTPTDFAETINLIGRQYNDADVLVEINDIGQQVAESLFFDYEYPNVLFTESAGRAGKRITTHYRGSGTDRGIRTTKTVKSVGCSLLKLLVEQQQLEIVDRDTISELATFSKKNNSYEAEPGNHDDLVACLFLFAWLSDQQYFKERTEINTLLKLRDRTDEQLMNELTPFGFVVDHIERNEYSEARGTDNWIVVDQNWEIYK